MEAGTETKRQKIESPKEYPLSQIWKTMDKLCWLANLAIFQATERHVLQTISSLRRNHPEATFEIVPIEHEILVLCAELAHWHSLPSLIFSQMM